MIKEQKRLRGSRQCNKRNTLNMYCHDKRDNNITRRRTMPNISDFSSKTNVIKVICDLEKKFQMLSFYLIQML